MVYFWTLKLLNRSEIAREVIKTYYANDITLRRSAELPLTPENHHFEGSMHLNAKECRKTRLGEHSTKVGGQHLWSAQSVVRNVITPPLHCAGVSCLVVLRVTRDRQTKVSWSPAGCELP